MPNKILKSDSKLIKIDYHETCPTILSNELNIPKETLKVWNSWVKIDNNWYYFKEVNTRHKLINILLGEEVSLFFNLRSAHYEIAKKINHIPLIKESANSYGYGVLSLNFRDKDSNYYHLNELLEAKEDVHGKLFLKKEKNYLLEDLKKLSSSIKENGIDDEVTRMFIRDFYTNELDRRVCNFCIEEKNGIYNLGPLYDYESEFTRIDNYQTTVFGNYQFNRNGNPKIENSFPLFKTYKELILDLDILKLISNVEEKHNIIIPNNMKNYYNNFDNEKKKMIKKIK